MEGDVKSEYNFCEQVDVPIAERAYNLGGGGSLWYVNRPDHMGHLFVGRVSGVRTQTN